VPHYEFMTPHVPHYEFMTPHVPHYEFMTPMKSLRGRQKSQEVGYELVQQKNKTICWLN